MFFLNSQSSTHEELGRVDLSLRIFLLLLPMQLPLVKASRFHTNVKLMVSCADEGSACFLRTELTAFFKSWTINLIHWSAHRVYVSHYILICLKDNCDL